MFLTRDEGLGADLDGIEGCSWRGEGSGGGSGLVSWWRSLRMQDTGCGLRDEALRADARCKI